MAGMKIHLESGASLCDVLSSQSRVLSCSCIVLRFFVDGSRLSRKVYFLMNCSVIDEETDVGF